MRRLATLAVVALALALPAGMSHGARETSSRITPPVTAPATPYELVVFEADGCIYCEVFRRDVLPLYSTSEVNREAPIRFVNLTYADESRMGLAAPINIAPTVVLLQDGREVDRITGYTGPIGFLRLVNAMMGKTAMEPE